MPPTLLDEKQIGTLTEGLQSALSDLNATRKQMAAKNDEVAALIKLQEALVKQSGNNESGLLKVNEEMSQLAQQMKTIAEQHTNLVHLTTKGMRQLGSATPDSDLAYVVSLSGFKIDNPKRGEGVIFQSRRQAQEIGMWLIATQSRETEGRLRARKWIQNEGGNLRFMPNIPISFIQDFGNEWSEKMKAMQKYADVPGIDPVLQTLKGGTTPGSVLVQPEFSDALVRNVEEYGVFRQNAMIWPMASDTVYIPRRESGIDVYWEGEAEAGTTTEPDWTLLGMTAKKMLMLTQVSSELSEDSAITIAALLMQEYALAFATEEDRIGFNGTGTGGNSPGFAGYVGVLGAAAHATPATADTNGVPIEVVGETDDDTTPEVTEYTLREMTGVLHTWARGNAKWYLHRTVLADFAGISMGTAGGSVVAFQDGLPKSIMGYPTVEVEAMPVSPSSANTHVVALGDLRKSWILGDRRSVEVQTSEHYAFNSDQLTTRAKSRIGFLMIQGNGMVVLQLAA